MAGGGGPPSLISRGPSVSPTAQPHPAPPPDRRQVFLPRWHKSAAAVCAPACPASSTASGSPCLLQLGLAALPWTPNPVAAPSPPRLLLSLSLAPPPPIKNPPAQVTDPSPGQALASGQLRVIGSGISQRSVMEAGERVSHPSKQALAVSVQKVISDKWLGLETSHVVYSDVLRGHECL